MRITIIPVDGLVGVNNLFYTVDMNACGVPSDIHALQWEEHEQNKGHIEFKSAQVQNQDITALPEWVTTCVEKWQAAKDAQDVIDAQIQAAQDAAKALRESEQP